MIETFLTAYDPSDLPGTSIDPLGFERGYLFLADKILPGLTNVASRPRYLALICAGISFSGEPPAATPQELIRARRESILRLERFWALANVLARPDRSGGVRGVTYATARADELRRSGATRTNAKYPLLSRQSQYGAIGMYASVADGMRFLNREDLTLTPALGEVAAEAFSDETELPATLRRAILDDGEVSAAALEAWGERAHVEGEVRTTEAKCIMEALNSNPVRARMAALLDLHPWTNEQETELERLSRVARTLRHRDQNRDLREAIECIIEFESCYQVAVLALERLLWLCRHHSAAFVTLCELNNDAVLQSARERFPLVVGRFIHSLDNGSEANFRQDLDRLSDVRRFLEEASSAVSDCEAFIGTIINRHTDVQHGKFDRGRRKMPWLERHESRINLTLTRAGGMNWEAAAPEHIAPHPYRLRAADSFNLASSRANPS